MTMARWSMQGQTQIDRVTLLLLAIQSDRRRYGVSETDVMELGERVVRTWVRDWHVPGGPMRHALKRAMWLRQQETP